jgi:phytoene synthase
MDELKQFNVPAADILNAKYSDNFTALMKFQAERAEKYYEQAFAHFRPSTARVSAPA